MTEDPYEQLFRDKQSQLLSAIQQVMDLQVRLNEKEKQLAKALNREKYWQKAAGKLADIANRMYEHVDERNLTETEVADVHEMHEYIHNYLDFDESIW